jgi:mycofactocin precursor
VDPESAEATMADTTSESTSASASPDVDTPEQPTKVTEPATELVEDDLLVEDVSIDGMCGVY